MDGRHAWCFHKGKEDNEFAACGVGEGFEVWCEGENGTDFVGCEDQWPAENFMSMHAD